MNLPFEYALITAAVYYYSLAALMIPVARWTARLHNRRITSLSAVAQHLGVGLGVITFWQTIILTYTRLAVGPNFWQITYAPSWRFQLVTATATYGTAQGLTLTFQAADREHERKRRESELLILARDSELATIKSQLQPHFVLNVLNSLLVLIEENPPLAKTMVLRLSEVMRAAFEQFDAEQIPLKREIELTRAYLEIERIRFGPRLSVVIDVDDHAAETLVPAFVLQPIVENAIKHGIGLQTGPGELRISAKRHNDRLALAVTNTCKPAPLTDLSSGHQANRGSIPISSSGFIAPPLSEPTAFRGSSGRQQSLPRRSQRQNQLDCQPDALSGLAALDVVR